MDMQIRNGTSIESAIITRSRANFFKYLARFVLAMFPIAFVNNLLKYALNEP
jgi:ATP-binding cassette subfamily D (ALD) protein 3